MVLTLELNATRFIRERGKYDLRYKRDGLQSNIYKYDKQIKYAKILQN